MKCSVDVVMACDGLAGPCGFCCRHCQCNEPIAHPGRGHYNRATGECKDEICAVHVLRIE